jgi:putative hydrolase of the HAD superfamily
VPAVQYAAVLFDLGGVVLPSPFDAFVAHERERGLPDGFLRGVVSGGGETGAWAQLERGELDLDEFAIRFEAECAQAGGVVSASGLMAAIHTGSGPRPEMLEAIAAIRAHGLRTGAITNNWAVADPVDQPFGDRFGGLFDVVIESSASGLRKPDPRIYRLACDELGVQPEQCVFLDDLGVNLKPARELGMTTIKVIDPDAALAELESVLGFPLG